MFDRDEDRGTGRTTRQMQAAPKDAVFVWCFHGSLGYARDLARHLGRADLKIVSPSWLENSQYMGLTFSGIVTDHAMPINGARHRGYRDAITRVRAA